MQPKLFALTFASALILFAAGISSPKEPLVVHEWGTFTSVADERGRPVEWAAWSGPADLPCFVSRLDPSVQGSFKTLPGFVRLETPVLYFYPQKRTTLSVHVDFPQGWITEWYPQASAVRPSSPGSSQGAFRGGSLQWDSVDVTPGEQPQFPLSKGASHYFAARETDSAPVRIASQNEKFLFYRGIGSFQVPLRPKFTANARLEISNTGTDPIPLAMVFENRGGKLGYRVFRNIQAPATVDLPELNASVGGIREELARDLAEFGLHQKEALAMIETWRDSWFEEGTRIVYIYPRAAVDSKLPLSITPAPSSLTRVFVGRVELLAPWLEERIRADIQHGSIETMVKYGRFLDSFLGQMERTENRKLYLQETVAEARRVIQRQATATTCVK